MRLAISLATFVLAALPCQSQDNPPGKASEARGPVTITPQAPLSAKAGPAASAGIERMAPDAAGSDAIPAKPGSPEGEHDRGGSGGGGEGAAPVPEPSSLLLVGTGLVGLVLTSTLRRRQRRHS